MSTRASSLNKTRFNNPSQELTKTVQNFKNSEIETFMENLFPPSSTDYWLRKVTKRFTRLQVNISPLWNSVGSLTRSREEKAIEFAVRLRQFQVFPVIHDEEDVN